jgi:hypothetical protein
VAETKLRLISVCSLCGHEYAKLFDTAELDEHMAEAHGMYFDPRVKLG